MANIKAKCPNCKEVLVVTANPAVCPNCKNKIELSTQGGITIYRKGAFAGMALGYGLYINGEPFGHIANKETVKLPLPFGTYTIHCTCGMTRRCNDLTVTISQDKPFIYIKASIKMGVWSNTINLEECTKEQMAE